MHMKKIVIPVVIVLAAVLAWVILGRSGEAGAGYRFVKVQRGDVESVVSSTGVLQATRTVEVGTQVSGRVAEILVDFNDHVTQGQLLARIDPTILQQEVRAAEASLERSEAELRQTGRELERMKQLYERKVVTETEYNSAEYEHDVAQAASKSAQVSLERARRNLDYTSIYAPIDGVVLDRQVDVGQTVAASFSAPVLFLIAEDLAEMEILASVDESDVSKIYEGQEVRFTVQAYPDESFTGKVRQARLQSASQENVVSYTVVVKVDNPDGRLLPGMTATADFIVAQATGVLKVSNAALRFQPTDEMWKEFRGRGGQAPAGSPAESVSSRRINGATARAGSEPHGPFSSSSERRELVGTSNPRPVAEPGQRVLLWYVDADGKVNATPVQTGVSDSQSTEIRGDGIREGMEIIAAVTSASTSGTSNPFQSGRTQTGRPGPPPGM
jgi:HlyD family secretion protein